MFSLFEFVSDLFQPVVARYGDEFTKKFDLEIYNKSTSGQILLQSRTSIITNCDSFDVLQSAKQDNYY